MRGRWLLAVLAATSADAACTAIAVQSDPVDVSLRKYGDNVDECWDVSCTSPNAVGSLSFSVFGTQQGSDFVIVDATSYSGSTLPPDTPFAAGVTLNVRFTSNGDTITDTGFAAAATCTIPSTPAPVETCTNVVVDSTDPVSVEQLGYANDLDICWLLDFQCAGEAVAELIFTAFDTEPTFDIVKVGSTDYSGTTLPPATTFEASLRVGFISDEGVTKAGFSAQASCIVPSTPAPAVCSSVVVSSTATQTIERLNYGDGDDVCWQVSCSSSLADGSAVFTAMDTEESTDIVKVNGVSYSGTALPGGGGSVHTWRDGTFEVSFTSDENGVTGVGSPTGFSITVECALDECEVSGTTCTDAGQVCDDATRNVMNDWTCTCEAPTVGQATAAVAACTFDECDPSGCGSGQVCDDPDKDAAVRNNWKCTCIYPTEGEATGAPADCTLDECESEGCGYLQYCNDPTDGTTETGDWTCTCVTPSEGSVATGEDATCTLDECADSTKGCGAMQSCDDPTDGPTQTGDWTCTCIDPADGLMTTGQHASCVLDECATPGCGYSQTCDDPNTNANSRDDYVCTCVAPASTGSAVGQDAVCVLDECDANPCGHMQTCSDPQKTTSSIDDWMCTCSSPATGTAGTAAHATCTYDECVTFCTDPWFECDDVDQTTDNNQGVPFECVCIGDEDGSRETAYGSEPSCVYDDCTSSVCMDDGASWWMGCREPNDSPGSRDDHMCTCVSPAVGPEVAGADGSPAVCTWDECSPRNGHPPPCGAYQNCVDVAPYSTDDLNDYTCSCVSPADGNEIGSPADCEYDECLHTGDACAESWMTCNDPNADVGHLDDWVCSCADGTDGVAGGPAGDPDCKRDECLGTEPCGSEPWQVCQDVNNGPGPDARDNWKCTCKYPAEGIEGTAGPATSCTQDECLQADACGHMQTCTDVSPYSPGNLDDYVCSCTDPAVGTDGPPGEAAQCTWNECDNYCTESWKTCNDPTTATDETGDYTCGCNEGVRDPTTVTPGEDPSCVYDECVQEQDPCGAEQWQVCTDPNTSPGSKNDWICSCDPSSTTDGSPGAATQPATCTRDECLTGPCGYMQTCSEGSISPGALGDYQCQCDSPAESDPAVVVGGPAPCTLNECHVGRGHCLAAWMSCNDPTSGVTQTDDWICSCTADTLLKDGTVAGAQDPVCLLDECRTVGCGKWQFCYDENQHPTATDTWTCACVPPTDGDTVTGTDANCELDECTAPGKGCDGDGDWANCTDNKDPDLTNDWICSCVYPNTGIDATGTSATCSVDDCEERSGGCSSSWMECIDPDVDARSRDDWVCNCVGGTDGDSVPLGDPSCILDECETNDCSDAPLQACNDPITDPAAALGDWQCVCQSPATGTAGEQEPGICTLDECTIETCGFEQTCSDTEDDAGSRNDWKCNCAPEYTGVESTASPATCVLDECATECTDDWMSCHDPDTAAESQGDWICTCSPPHSGTQGVGQDAACTVEDCALGGCGTDPWQVCTETSTDPTSRDDWKCKCAEPNTGTETSLGPATCTNDECEPVSGCGDWQYCFDQFKSPDSLNDWTCTCVYPTSGTKTTAEPADCTLDECEDEDCGQPQYQECVDPDKDPDHTDDWECRCIDPATGGPEVRGSATCIYDECLIVPDPCGHMQSCEDPNKSPDNQNDWICTCISPATEVVRIPLRRAVLLSRHANCELDECADPMVCNKTWQVCTDPNKDTQQTGDWMCECGSIADGRNTALREATGYAPAEEPDCVLDECSPGGGADCSLDWHTCSDVADAPDSLANYVCSCGDDSVGATTGNDVTGGPADCIRNDCDRAPCGHMQDCTDQDPYSPGNFNDFACTCSGFAEGAADQLGMPANCTLDECVTGVCAESWMSCSDPEPKATDAQGDWVCQCVADPDGVDTVGEDTIGEDAHCVLDECLLEPPPCGDEQWQECNDPNTSPDSKLDWTCSCGGSTNGATVTAAAAVCEEDECVSVGCGEFQTCLDEEKYPSPGYDFSCTCTAPATGPEVTGASTVCIRDECTESHCVESWMSCEDDNQSPDSTGDWMCYCDDGTTDARPTQNGEEPNCKRDECLVNDCGFQQNCFDGNRHPTSTNDWTCTCLDPSSGDTTTGGPASCLTDECQTETCGFMQSCEDTDQDPTSTGDWTCTCTSPSTGTPAEGEDAECEWNECLTTSCGDWQYCNDPDKDPASSLDYTCTCVPPTVGVKTTGRAATCVLDECITIEKGCGIMQDCRDPDWDPNSVDDWSCWCVFPAVGTNGTGAHATCTLDECVEDVCGYSQACSDRNPFVNMTLDYTCTCVSPAIGTETTGQPAVCVHDECLTISGCAESWMVCNDPNTDPSSTGDWTCSCLSPHVGDTANSSDPICTLDECATTASCAADWMVCFDPDTNPTPQNHWMCACVSPTVGDTVTAGDPTCTLNECYSTGCGEVWMECNDPTSNPASTNDWTCACTSPTVGDTATGGDATCTLNECDSTGCGEVWMECNDPTSNPASTNDWTCACTSPTVGDIATGGDATCILDECTITSCGAEWQACNDPNTFPGVEDDWTCSCISPTVGEPATAAATTCTLNECNSTGCGGDWMSCSDPTSNPASTNDWTCTCLSPSIGDTATGKDAACTLDECETIGCGGDWMFCRDPNKDAGSTGDWTCTCLSPTVGKTATGGDATCILNECNANKECAEDWMHCADPNTSPDSEDDWTCSCISPALGKTVTAAVASCSWDECADPGCVADQVCDDPDQDAFSRGDYTCACTLPAVGPIGTGTDAQCTFDECGSSGCADGQVCDDPDTNQLSSGDWTCTCIAPTVGDAIGRAAVCTLDECKPSGCDDGQSCFDPDQDPDSKDDWTCTCVSPAVGNVTIGEPTACTLDECATSVCGKGQECTDPTRDPFATDDWTCTCPSPSIGSATAATANCTLDECTTAGAICKVAGQVCHDPDHNADVAGDWTCNCTSPRVGEATAAAAVCQLEECQTKLTVGLSDEKTQVIELFDYEPNELVCWTISCEVAGAIGSFEFGALNTEPKDDLVVVNGEPFSGSTVPEGVVATFTGGAAAEVLFRGDSDAIGGTDDEDSGFSVNVTCKLPPTLAPATVAPPTRAPPTAAPKTSAPTMAPTLAPSTGSPPTSAPEEEIELAMSFEVELQTGNVFDAGTRMRQQIEVSMNSSLTFRGACRRVNGSAGEECFTADELQAVAERRSAAALQSTPTWRFLFGLLLRSVTGVTAGAFEAAGETVTQTVLPGGKFLGAVAATPVPRVVITGDRAEDDDDSRSLFAGLLVGGVVLLVLLLSGAAFLLSRKPPAQHTEHAPHHKNEPIDS